MTTIAPAQRVHVDEPDVVGSLAVFPLIADDESAVEYLAFADAVTRGATITELEDASVNELLVANPLDVPVLLYAGQEVLGAKQNRIFAESALVLARTKRRVPVNCVEHGRWDGDRHAEPFRPAPQAAPPTLRAQPSQSAVWGEVRARAARAGVASHTEAIHDVYEHHRADLDGIGRKITRRDRQVGTIAAVAGRFVILDRVSRPDVWAALHGPIVQGYALDGLEHKAGATPSIGDALAFVASGNARALHHEGELIALTVFG